MELQTLKDKIIAANTAYRSGTAIMTDAEFDSLCEEAQSQMSQEDWNAFRDSLNEGKGKVKHPYVMGSLDKLKYEEPDEVIKFVKSLGNEINVSAKVDGISCRASYKNGKLVAATTRGDGNFGENITDKAMFVKGLPHELKSDGAIVEDDLEIRGELVILKDDFLQLNEMTNGKFANARNACAGIMNRKDWDQAEVQRVSFVPYTILGQEYTKEAQFKRLRCFDGIEAAWAVDINVNSISDINETFFQWASQQFDYETDGLVICACSYVNEDQYRPDACKAFKTNQQTAITTLLDISWEGPSKDGLFIGVGILDPVELGGAMISRVTLHNLDFIKEMGLKYGSKVEITRRGDVIPHIDKLVSNEGAVDITLPSICPSCGGKLVSDGLNMKCQNKDCPERVLNQVVLFIKNLGVKSASNATLKNIGVTDFKKLAEFSPNEKYKTETKLAEELKLKMFSRSKVDLLANMTSFEGLAEKTIKKIIDHYGWDTILGYVSEDAAGYHVNGHLGDLSLRSLPAGIGEITFSKFVEGFREAYTNMMYIASSAKWSWTPSAAPATSVKSTGKSVCFTGKLNTMGRSDAAKLAEKNGYEVKSSVTKGLTYLVTNDVNSGSSKNKKAAQLGTKIIDEKTFLEMMDQDKATSAQLDAL